MGEKFVPAFGLSNRHIQTLFATFFRKNKELTFEIETFTLSDNDFIEAYWNKSNKDDTNAPIVILFHGLTGSYNSPYIQGLMQKLEDNNFRSVLMHFRGSTGKMNLHPRSYHSGDTADAREFAMSIKSRYPNTKLYGVGFSLGGNMLLKLLGEDKKTCVFDAAVSTSAPLDLATCANEINRGFSKLYQHHLMSNLRSYLIEKYTKHNMQELIHIDKKSVKKLKTFWEYDAAYTAPIHGFKSVHDYYNKCSAKQYLKYIQIPTLIIHAKDDPFMNPTIIPTQEEISEFVHLSIAKNGGHVGFVSGSILKPTYWLEEKIVSYLKSLT